MHGGKRGKWDCVKATEGKEEVAGTRILSEQTGEEDWEVIPWRWGTFRLDEELGEGRSLGLGGQWAWG